MWRQNVSKTLEKSAHEQNISLTDQYFRRDSSGYGNLISSSKTPTWPLMMQACRGSHFSTVDTFTRCGNFWKFKCTLTKSFITCIFSLILEILCRYFQAVTEESVSSGLVFVSNFVYRSSFLTVTFYKRNISQYPILCIHYNTMFIFANSEIVTPVVCKHGNVYELYLQVSMLLGIQYKLYCRTHLLLF